MQQILETNFFSKIKVEYSRTFAARYTSVNWKKFAKKFHFIGVADLKKLVVHVEVVHGLAKTVVG